MIRRTAAVLVIVLAAAAPAAADGVDLFFVPDEQTTCLGAVLDIQFVVASDGPNVQAFDAVDAVLSWDPAALQLLGSDQDDAEATFLLAGFLNDPDGVNTDLGDGDAIFTALGRPQSELLAPPAPGDLIITTFSFEVLSDAGPASLQLLAAIGVFGHSRALLDGIEVTGALGQSTVMFSCPPDFTGNGVIDAADLAGLLGAWGTPGCDGQVTCCPDLTGDGAVNAADLAALLGAWGNCPS